MKRIIAALASVLGLSTGTSAQETKMVDPKTLLYSIATIENALPPLSNTAPRGDTPLTISEDDWRQFEFISVSKRQVVHEEIETIDNIFNKYSVDLKNGWRAFKQMHVRERIPVPITEPLSWRELKSALGPNAVELSAVTFRGAQTAIADGFAMKLGQLSFYGIKHGDQISVLCIETDAMKPALPRDAAASLVAYFTGNGLMLVRWTNRMTIEDKSHMSDFFTQK